MYTKPSDAIKVQFDGDLHCMLSQMAHKHVCVDELGIFVTKDLSQQIMSSPCPYIVEKQNMWNSLCITIYIYVNLIMGVSSKGVIFLNFANDNFSTKQNY